MELKKTWKKLFDSLSRAVDLGSEIAHLALIDLNFQENLEMDLKKSVKNVENKINTDPSFGTNIICQLTYQTLFQNEDSKTYLSKFHHSWN